MVEVAEVEEVAERSRGETSSSTLLSLLLEDNEGGRRRRRGTVGFFSSSPFSSMSFSCFVAEEKTWRDIQMSELL